MAGRLFTEREDLVIKILYSDNCTSAVAKKLNRSISSIYGRANFFGLSKSKFYLEALGGGRLAKGHQKGQITQFIKGHAPSNKGKKQTEYMTPAAIKKTMATRFKKGQKIHNEKNDGDISIRKDKRGVPYKHIRLSKGKWQYLHIYNYEKHNGKLPPGGVVRFQDRDTMNCDIENLVLIDKAENMRLNTIHRYPPEVKSLMMLQGKLVKTISKKEKNGKG